MKKGIFSQNETFLVSYSVYFLKNVETFYFKHRRV